MPEQKVNLLVLNQYFPPDQAATGQLLGQLVDDLSRHRVTVICGTPTYNPDLDQPPPACHQIRIPLLKGSRKNLFIRLLNYFLFLVGALVRATFLKKPDVVLCWTDPPLIGLIGAFLKYFKGSRFLFVSQDVYPEIVEAAGKMNNPLSRYLLSLSSRIILQSADMVVAVGEDMRQRLLGKGCPSFKLEVIPNWQDLETLTPLAHSSFREKQGFTNENFLVMHSGNIGFSQDFTTLLQAAERVEHEPHIQFLILGDGGGKKELLRQMAQQKSHNVHLLPYQPGAELIHSLNAADLHYVSLKPAFTGLVVPSKIYGILAVGKPVVANVDPACEVARIVETAQCGKRVAADPEALAQSILSSFHERATNRERGLQGRQWLEQNGGRKTAALSYQKLLNRLAPEKAIP